MMVTISGHRSPIQLVARLICLHSTPIGRICRCSICACFMESAQKERPGPLPNRSLKVRVCLVGSREQPFRLLQVFGRRCLMSTASLPTSAFKPMPGTDDSPLDQSPTEQRLNPRQIWFLPTGIPIYVFIAVLVERNLNGFLALLN